MKPEKKSKPNPNQVKDFSKTKSKVGKVAPKAANFTDTKFKAKAIRMPSQNAINVEKGEDTNFRNLGLTELIAQLSHYSPAVRRDAFLGLKDLFTRHPNVLNENLGTIMENIVQGIVDEERAVRVSAHTLFYFMFNTLSENQVGSFMNLWMVYTTCGLSHMQQAIRTDSLVVLKLLFQFPSTVWAFHMDLLPIFVNLLSDRDIVNDSQRNAVSSELDCILKLLRLYPNTVEINDASRKYDFLSKFWIEPHRPKRNAGSGPYLADFKKLPAKYVNDNSMKEKSTATLLSLASSMFPIILSNWLVLDNLAQNTANVTAVLHSLKILALIIRSEDPNSSTLQSCLKDLLKLVFPYFPFQGTSSNDLASIIPVNLLLCDLMTLFVEKDSPWIENILMYMGSLFTEAVFSSITNNNLNLMLSVFKSLLDHISEDKQVWLLENFTKLYNSLHFLSRSKQTCLSTILIIQPGSKWLHYEFGISWIKSIPEFLIILAEKHKDEVALNDLLSIVLSCARFYSAEVFSYDNFMNELCPFFETMHRNLNIEMQLSALRCLHYVTTFSSQLFRSLALICRNQSLNVDVRQFIVEIVFSRRTQIPVSSLLSFLLSSIFPPSNADDIVYKETLTELRIPSSFLNIILVFIKSAGLGQDLANVLAPMISRVYAGLHIETDTSWTSSISTKSTERNIFQILLLLIESLVEELAVVEWSRIPFEIQSVLLSLIEICIKSNWEICFSLLLCIELPLKLLHKWEDLGILTLCERLKWLFSRDFVVSNDLKDNLIRIFSLISLDTSIPPALKAIIRTGMVERFGSGVFAKNE